uniref:Alpha-1-antitrypsin 1-4 n=1 Tax=Schistosoma haematobium TaxID=6185 RepID=A0A095ATL3_SCHHA
MDVIQSLRNFSEKLYREILKRNEGYLENTFLSPFNIYTALGMIFCGSANNTNAELIKAMLLPDCLEQEIIHSAIGELLADLSKPDESVEIIIENRFYVNEDVQIEKRFRNIIKQHYNALTEHIDEEGVVAAAATLCIFAGCALNSSKPVVEFRVDHSFFVSIIWNNTLPIFLGHVTTPVND